MSFNSSPPRQLQKRTASPPRQPTSLPPNLMSDHSPSRSTHTISPPRRLRGVSPPRQSTSTDSLPVSPPRQSRRTASPPLQSRFAVSPPRQSRPTASPPLQSRSPPRQSRPAISPPHQSRPAISPPRQSRPAISPPLQSRSAVSPPHQSRPAISPPRQSRSAVSPPRQSRPAISPPRSAVSPPRQSRPAISPPRQSRPAISPPRQSNRSPSCDDPTQESPHQSNQQSGKRIDFWAQVALLTRKQRYNAFESQKQLASRTAGLPLKYRDPLYLFHRDEKKTRILYLDNKAKHKKLLLEEKLNEEYRLAQLSGNTALVHEIELKLQHVRAIEQSNLQNHIRLQSLQTITTPVRDEEGLLIKMTKRPRFMGLSSYQNRFNIPPGYRWDGIDRSLRDEQKFSKK